MNKTMTKLMTIVTLIATVFSATAFGFRPIFHPPTISILDALRNDEDNFSILIGLIKDSGLNELTKEGKSFTLLAPTNAALAKLPNGTLASFKKDKNKLRQLLFNHLLPGKVLFKEMFEPDTPADEGKRTTKSLKNLGDALAYFLCDASTSHAGKVHLPLINGKARVLEGDFEGKSAVIHVIDTVLLPEDNSASIGVDSGVPFKTETANGLNTTTFDTLVGTVTINLPDDLAAGDTISGTVIAEVKKPAKNENPTEQAKAQDELSGYVVEIAKQETPVKKEDGNLIDFCKDPTANTNDYSLTVCKKLSIPDGVAKIPLVLKNKEGKIVAQAEVPVAPKANPAKVTEGLLTPAVGQAGKPISVIGPFDGDFKNTAIKLGNLTAKFLASSPRKVVVESPRDLKGVNDIAVEYKGNLVAKCTYRSISIKLSADKLNLTKGEQTNLTLMVHGLIGLLSPISVQLSNRSVNTLNMDGGNLQTVKIEPSQVNGDIYTTRRGLTGLSAGGFSITAVVDISSYVQGNLNKCMASSGPPVTPIPQPSQPTTPDPNPTATPVPATQPTPSPTPQPTPQSARGRFQVTLNGFRVIRVTNRGAFQRPDAVRFQPEILSVSTGTPLIGATLHGGLSYTIGSSEYPVRGGSAPGGGFRNGDGFPDQMRPEVRTLPLSTGIATIPPTQYYRNYENELIQGENAVVIIPSIWSIDNNSGLGLRERFLDAVGGRDTRAAIRAAVTTIIRNPPSLALGNFLVPGSTVGIPNTMSLAIGVPQDRPIGMRPVGRQFGFTPQALILTYESADFMSRGEFGFGRGIVPVRYTDDAAFGGDYELYFQVERLDDCPSDIAGARFVGSAELRTSHREAPGPYPGALDLRVNFTDCRRIMRITDFPPLVNTSETSVGPNTSTLTMYSGGIATFVRATGAIDLQMTLGLVNTHGLFGNSTLPVRLTGSINPATGIATLRGTGRFSGGQLGTTSTDGTIVITGRFSPMP